MLQAQENGDPVLPSSSPSIEVRSLDPPIITQSISHTPRHRASVTSWPTSYEVHEFGLRGRDSRPPPITVSSESSRESLTSPVKNISHPILSQLHATQNPFTTPPSTPDASLKTFTAPVSVISSESQYSLPSGISTSIELSRATSSSKLNTVASNNNGSLPSTEPRNSSANSGPLLQRRARRERSFAKGQAPLSVSTSNINLNFTPPSSPPAVADRNSHRDTFASPPAYPGIVTSGASTPSTRTASSKHVNSWRIPSTLNDEKGFVFDLSGVDASLKAIKAQEKDITPSESSISLTDGYFTSTVEKDHDIPIRPSALLLGTIHKPWLEKKDWRLAASWWITFLFILIGFGGAAAYCATSYFTVNVITSPLCMVMDENFDTLDLNTWSRIVDMSGFQNGEFEMTTDFDNNSYVKDGVLYIVPTLTSEVIGVANVFDAFSYNVTNCTNTVDFNGCGAVSNATAGTVIPPIMTGRLTTQFSRSLTYGKVEIRARMPQGDWIWPTLWMLPVNDTYGPWPASGEIDIAFSRGNGITYAGEGQNSIRSSLNWGPTVTLNREFSTFGVWSSRRQSFANDFHTYSLEWTDKYIRMYIDARTDRSLEISFDTPFFKRGDFPPQIMNGTATVPLENPWAGRGNSAPFDQPFYLILSLSVGGTDGIFPDNVGGKPWLDASQTAMREFALAQDQWYPTWPANLEERGLAVDYVRMWELC